MSAGKVVVWSNDATQFHGTITARGGAQSGDGGHVEVSGGKYAGIGGEEFGLGCRFHDLTCGGFGFGAGPEEQYTLERVTFDALARLIVNDYRAKDPKAFQDPDSLDETRVS